MKSYIVPEQLALWEEQFCLPLYQGKRENVNSVYLETQRLYASCCLNGEAADLWGICATTCGTPWAGLNLAFLTQPVRAVERVKSCLTRARAFYEQRSVAWILVVPDQWVAPGQHQFLYALLQETGFHLAMDAYAIEALNMEALPCSDLRILPATNSTDWQQIALINALAWDVPADWINPLFESGRFQAQARGYLGLLDQEAIAAVVNFPVDRYNFLAWGATLPSYRRRGYGEEITRHAAVHSQAGRPLLAIGGPHGLPTWLRCGFTKGERFRLYLAPTTQSAQIKQT